VADLAVEQGQRVRALLRELHGRNPFFTHKLRAAGFDGARAIDALEFPRDLARLPLTTKAELVEDQDRHPPFGTVLTEPIDHYTRYNQTSSTTGRPLRWLDTNDSWQWMLECWKAVYAGARVGQADRILFAFSFGPFLGFWTAFEAGCQIGAHCIPAGGMSSRLVCGLLADHTGWRGAFAGLGVLGVLAAFEFWRSLPPSRRFQPSAFDPRVWAADLRHHLRDPGLPWLFLIAFLLMGSFVSLYNYLGYRLGGAAFGLSHSGIGAIFLLYVLGMIASPWAGRRADRQGRLRTLSTMLALMFLGLGLTISDALPAVIAGVALYTFGFFGAHSVASGWVGRQAVHAKTLAASMYLCAYYLGASAMGWASGHAWSEGGWPGVVGFLCLLLTGCALAASRLRR